MHKPNPEVRVSVVSVRQLGVPPLSAQVIECELDAKLGRFLLEPVRGFPDGLLFAKSLNSPGERGKICVVNGVCRSLNLVSLSVKQCKLTK